MAQTLNPTQTRYNQGTQGGQGGLSQQGGSEPQRHSEGSVARNIEEQTAKLPSDLFLWAALGSMGVAAFLKLTDRKHDSLFVGQWAAPFLLLGVYNKLVKIAGSDRTQQQ